MAAPSAPQRDAVARLRQAHQRALEAARVRQQRVGRHVHIVEHQLAGVAGAQRQLALLVLGLKPGVSVGTMKPRMDLSSSPSPVLAQMIATSAVEPLVIHILAPLITHEPSPARARA
jgi:hypothetical protein